jgi:hypothetical protein
MGHGQVTIGLRSRPFARTVLGQQDRTHPIRRRQPASMSSRDAVQPVDNPFIYTSSAATDTEYVGRDDVRAWVTQAVRSKARLAISGRHRMGTTSTLNLALYQARQSGLPSAYVDACRVRLFSAKTIVRHMVGEVGLSGRRGANYL